MTLNLKRVGNEWIVSTVGFTLTGWAGLYLAESWLGFSRSITADDYLTVPVAAVALASAPIALSAFYKMSERLGFAPRIDVEPFMATWAQDWKDYKLWGDRKMSLWSSARMHVTGFKSEEYSEIMHEVAGGQPAWGVYLRGNKTRKRRPTIITEDTLFGFCEMAWERQGNNVSAFSRPIIVDKLKYCSQQEYHCIMFLLCGSRVVHGRVGGASGYLKIGPRRAVARVAAKYPPSKPVWVDSFYSSGN